MITGRVLGNYSLLQVAKEEVLDRKAETIREANARIARMVEEEYKVYYRATDKEGNAYCFPTIEELCYQLHLKLGSVLYQHRKQRRRFPVFAKSYTIEKVGEIGKQDKRKLMRGMRSRGGAQVYVYEVEELGGATKIFDKIADVAPLVGLKAGSLRSAFNRRQCDVMVKNGYKVTRFVPAKAIKRGQPGRENYVYTIRHPDGQKSEARTMEAFLHLLDKMPLCTAQSRFFRKGFLEYKGYYITRQKVC